jgi:signal transduction histidine kinase
VITVDEGSGIAPNARDEIWQPNRLRNESDGGSGAGLGLSIVGRSWHRTAGRWP